MYSRYGNPTISMFEERLRLIEDAPAAFATATGMAAVFTALGALLGAGGSAGGCPQPVRVLFRGV